jgi:hypothetical protein
MKSGHGAVVYVGSSREGLSQGRNVNYSSLYDALFFQKLFNKQPTVAPQRLGSVMAETKKDFIDLCNNNTNGYRWLQYAINPFGDPEMPIYTGFYAMEFYPTITCQGSNIIVSVGNFDGCTFALESTDSTRYEVVKNVSNSYTFQNVTSPVRITITEDDHIAYESGVIFPIGNDALVGNSVLCDSATYYINNLPPNAVVNWSLTGYPFSITKLDNNPYPNQCKLVSSSSWTYFGKLQATISIDGENIAVLEKNISKYNGIDVDYSQWAHDPYPAVSSKDANLSTPNYVNPECTIFVYSQNFRNMNVNYSGVTPLSWNHSDDNYLTFSLPTSSVGQTFTIHVRATSGNGNCNNFDIPFIATTGSVGTSNSQQLQITSEGNLLSISLDDKSINQTIGNIEWKVDIFDATIGKKAFSGQKHGTVQTIDTSSWKPGVYVAKCQLGNEILTEKFVIAK